MPARKPLRLAMTAVVLAAGLTMQGMTGAEAQGTPQANPAENGAPQRLWSVSCADGANGAGSQCQMVQTLAMKQTGKRLLTIAVQKAENNENARLIVGLPHGVYFPSGIFISVDEGEKSQVQLETSDPNGAYATTDVDAGLLEALRQGTQLKVSFEGGNRQALVVPVSLEGFADAYRRVASFGG